MLFTVMVIITSSLLYPWQRNFFLWNAFYRMHACRFSKSNYSAVNGLRAETKSNV